MPRPVPWRWLAALALAAVFVLALLYGPSEAQILAQQQQWRQWADDRPVSAKLIYLGVIFVSLSLSLPLGGWLTVGAGFLFGRFWGLVIANLGATAGAVVAFLIARHLLYDALHRQAARSPALARRLERIDAGVRRDGAFYLLLLRLTPVVPYFVLNAAMGLTPIRLLTYWWITQLGMIPVAFVFINAGASVSNIDRLSDLVSAEVLVSMSLMVLVPLALRRLRRGKGRGAAE